MSTAVIPEVTGSNSPYVSPATWVTGIGSNKASAARIACAAAMLSASCRSVWCVCTTPFGSAVVPEVHSTTAGSSTPTATAGAGRALARCTVAHRDHDTVVARVVQQRPVVGSSELVRYRDHVRAGLAEDEADLVGPQARGDRARDRAAAPDRPPEHHGLPPVRQLPRDDIARPDAQAPQPRRDVIDGARSSSIVTRKSPSTRARCSPSAVASRSSSVSSVQAPCARQRAWTSGGAVRTATARRRPGPAAGPSPAVSRTVAPSSDGSQRAPLSSCGPCCQPSATEMMPPSTSNTRPVTLARLGAAEPYDERRHVARDHSRRSRRRVRPCGRRRRPRSCACGPPARSRSRSRRSAPSRPLRPA